MKTPITFSNNTTYYLENISGYRSGYYEYDNGYKKYFSIFVDSKEHTVESVMIKGEYSYREVDAEVKKFHEKWSEYIESHNTKTKRITI